MQLEIGVKRRYGAYISDTSSRTSPGNGHSWTRVGTVLNDQKNTNNETPLTPRRVVDHEVLVGIRHPRNPRSVTESGISIGMETLGAHLLILAIGDPIRASIQNTL